MLGFVPHHQPTFTPIKLLSIAMKQQTGNAPPKTPSDSILKGIERGEKDIKEGNVYTHAQAKEKLKKWLKP